MASRFRAVRTAVAVLGAAVTVTMTAAIPATAEPATGLPTGEVTGYHVNVGKGKLRDILAKVFKVELSDGSTVDAYCVQVRRGSDPEHELVEQPWDAFPDADSPFHANRDKINWILHNSFPAVGRKALQRTLRDEGVKLHNGGLNREEAISGTQAAIWHFSDGVDLNRKNPLPVVGKGFDKDVLALYDYLTGDANEGLGDQPTPALEVTPTELSGEAGERIGPFTVTTTGNVTKLKADLPEGVTITDADGEELTAKQIENGTDLYLDVPADAEQGAVTIELTARAGIDTGRLFVGENYGKGDKTQSLITAKSTRTKITVTIGADWAAAPPTTTVPPTSDTSTTAPPTSTAPETTTEPTSTSSEAAPVPQPRNTSGLATTGASILMPVVIGLVLVGAGIGALLVLRRRRGA
ncbi:thioester domain-containing protein [Actinophytocola gossypii]|uniref:Thioester domain-containing protein n=1 Tax=Actinophytocola gossypii TaxID=2812003 RepID=A0ABT2J3H9_9PSEU|nr:thioester domain-containing protein [Actinophytocola gossypii]MCT2582412.1 thioester domain-containing protein [Actinophytocola gossypii]